LIVYDPTKVLRKLAPETKIERALTGRLSLKKTALSFTSKFDILDDKAIAKVALKTIKAYKKRAKGDPEIRAEIKADPAQLIQRVQNEVIFQVKEELKDRYSGEFYIWLPSDADEPDPEHQLNYGKKFQVGDGEMPGDRIGCRCGMEILTDDTQLEL